MSAEADFKALLTAHAPLTTLVRAIALSAAPSNSNYPLITYTATHAPERGMGGELLADEVQFVVNIWAKSPERAEEVKQALLDALATAPPQRYCAAVADTTTYDPDLDLDGIELTVEWTA